MARIPQVSLALPSLLPSCPPAPLLSSVSPSQSPVNSNRNLTTTPLSAHGEVHPLSPTPSPLPRKTSCRACGSPLFDEGRNMIMAFPPAFEFARTEGEKDKFETATKGKAHGHAHGAGEDGGKKVGLPDVMKAQCHIFYERRVMDVIDGVPKWRAHKDESEQMGETQRP